MIKVNKLSFSYNKSEDLAIKDVSFNIDKGEIFGFLGPSGAGKTTTQKLIIGLLRGYDGDIEIMGKERNLWNKDFFENIGVAFDFPNLYIKLTALENLRLIKSYYKSKGMDELKLLDMVGLTKDKDKRVEEFSKGMKMRLNFIRPLLHNPDILFFDEPTSGLDPVNAKIIKDMIMELKSKGKTVFLTTHNMTVAEQLCDRIGLMIDGRIEVIDSPHNLMVKHGDNRVRVDYELNGESMQSKFNIGNLKGNKEFKNIIENGEIKTIHSGEATLEDVFIKLTGRSLT